MKLVKKSKFEFKNCENTTTKKILINICDYLIYGLTDSNIFYRNLYVHPKRDYDNNQHNLGDIFYSYPLSYHIIANMVCVQLPKTTYNIIPFKLSMFKTCCDKLVDYVNKNEIKEIHTPIFGTKILEGNWKDILNILTSTFENSSLESLIVYE